jgi:predicted transposase/invertase (TIGR01784 family)
MLLTEWKMEDALAVRYEEGREEGWSEGREEGWTEGREEGRSEGREEGWSEGREERDIEIVKNALAKGLPIDIISTITGLDVENIRQLSAE